MHRLMNKEINQLSSAITQLFRSEPKNYFQVIDVMLTLMAKGVDLSSISGQIIKLLALPSPLLKKAVCTYLMRYSTSVSDLDILATNTLLRDFDDPNPYVRKLVIKTCCSVPCLHELALKLLPRALRDGSSVVRGVAVSSCALCINENNLDNNQDIIDLIYELIKDSDCSIVVNCLATLDDVLKTEGGIVINSRIAQYLMSRFLNFFEWDYTVVCNTLKKYSPIDSNEVLCYLKVIDKKLSHCNPAVFVPVAELALHFISKQDGFSTRDTVHRFFMKIQFFLNTSNSENLVSLLEIARTHSLQHIDIFLPHYKLFMCRFCDTAAVKAKKLSIIAKLGYNNNGSEVIEEILLHCKNVSPEVTKQAIESFVLILKSNPSLNIYMRTFLQLFYFQQSSLCSELVRAVSCIDLNDMMDEKDIILQNITRNFRKVTSIEGKKALLKIVSNYAEEIDLSAYIVQELATESQIFENEPLFCQFLSTSVKLFILRPAEMQLFLGQFLKSLENSNNIFLQKQALVNYHFLKKSV